MYAELVQDLGHSVVDQVADGLWEVVKAWHWGQDHRPGLGRLEHQAKVAMMERSLAHDEYQTPALLEADIGGPHDQVVVGAACDGGERANGARGDDHPVSQERAAGDGGGDVAFIVGHVRQREHLVGVAAHLVLDGLARRGAQDEVDLDVHVSQDLEEAYTVVGAAGAGQRDDEPSTGRHLFRRLRRCVALAPHERPPQADLKQLSKLARLWAPSCRRLVVHDLIVEGDLEDAFRAALQLETEQDRGPTVENLRCPTDSIIQVISRDAVLDDDVVLWVDHLVRKYLQGCECLPLRLEARRQ